MPDSSTLDIAPIYIDNDDQLAACCEQWSRADVLALDTEFIRTDTFFPIAGLIQVSDGNGIYLIDPLRIETFSPFAELLVDTRIIKLLHSCSEDLDVFESLLGVLPTPLLDTQVGAALAGIGFGMGYQRMIETLLDIHVPKGETRSDWLQRPLTESQIHYAALDVAHLHEVYSLLHQVLSDHERIDSWYEEGERLVERYRHNNTVDDYYLRVKSAWRLSSEQLSVLQAVTRWREQQARQRNIPRGRVLKDNVCLSIAQQMPNSMAQLSQVDDLSPKQARVHGGILLALVDEARNQSEQPALLDSPLPAELNRKLKQLRAWVNARAEQLVICPEILLGKKELEAILRTGIWPEGAGNWRRELLAKDILREHNNE